MRESLAVAAIALTLMCGAEAQANTVCRYMYDPMLPGTEQCDSLVELEFIVAQPPDPQKMSLWCWAASLSMIFTAEGHPISADSIVLQNFKRLADAPSGEFVDFEANLNRVYRDVKGRRFQTRARRIKNLRDASDALDDGMPILYTTGTHAAVQLSLTYQRSPFAAEVAKAGDIWDPEPGIGLRALSIQDMNRYKAAWKIEIKDLKQAVE